MSIVVLNHVLLLKLKSQLLGIERVFERQDLQMFDLILKKQRW